MRPLAPEFAKPRRWPRIALGVAGLLMSVVAAEECWQAARAMAELRTVEGTIGRRESEESTSRIAPDSAATNDAPYARDARRWVAIAAFDTPAVLASLEHVQLAGIRVAALDVSPREGRARVDLEIDDAAALLDYLRLVNTRFDSATGWQLARLQMPSGGSAGTMSLVLGPRDASGAVAPPR